MRKTTPDRMLGLQPPLPLVDPDGFGDARPTAAADAEWRLDEHTREVGRRGIAEARARLEAARHRGAERDRREDTPDRAPGRAA
jgi:hypothetical protein